MNRFRLTRERWASVLRWATRADNRERIAAGAIALLAFTSSFGIFFYIGMSRGTMSGPVLPNQHITIAPGVAEARSPEALGYRSPIGAAQDRTGLPVGREQDLSEGF